MLDIAQQTFDCYVLDAETRLFVEEKEQAIYTRLKRTVDDMVAIGQDLIAVKERLPRGMFIPWLNARFEFSVRTAQYWMHAAKEDYFKNAESAFLPASIVYESEYVIEQIEAGEIPATLSAIREAKREIQDIPVSDTPVYGLYPEGQARPTSEDSEPFSNSWGLVDGKPFTMPLPDGKPVVIPDSWKLPPSMRFEVDEEDDNYQWLYDPDTHEAYCKYCYKTHRLWEHVGFDDVLPGDHVWECQVCEHRTKDEFMQIESRVVFLEEDTEEEIAQAPRNSDNVPVSVPHIISKNNEWYTPEKYIEAARRLMCGIDLDPASCELANKTVKAERYFTKEDSGLNRDWTGRVWLNPPYGFTEGESNQAIWSGRLIDQFEKGITTEAVLLVNAAVDTKWLHLLFAYPVCLTLGRINFTTPETTVSGSTHGSAFVYFGNKPDEFRKIFGEFGTVVRRW